MHIDAYAFGSITIDGHTYSRDVIVFPDRVQPEWWRREGHRLVLADLEPVLAKLPQVLIVGTGAYGVMKVDPEVQERMAQEGVELVAETTDKAVERFNQESRDAVAALHLTC